jgi:hypothetical protein
MPTYNLNSQNFLELHFDELRYDFNDFFYTIIHCDRNWEPSNLSSLEYIEGFEENNILNEEYSQTRFISYNHYSARIPNRDMRPLLSGNYLLHVYRYDEVKTPVLTRRFMVYETRVPIEYRVNFPISNEPGMQYQEIDFNCQIIDPSIQNPMVNVRVDLYQNGRWDNAIRNLKANFSGLDMLKFNYVNKVVFQGLREFRFIDLRSTRLSSRQIRDIEETEEGIFITLESDFSRLNRPYFYLRDINGSFVIGNADFNFRDPNTSAEYLYVLFGYHAAYPFEGKDVYLFGEFTDWRLQEKYKMHYYSDANSYVHELLLKQGRYDYTYAIVDKGATKADMYYSEGGRYETENDYYFFVYYRNPVERYDRIVGYRKMSTNQFE